jgi:hypothetical protein
MASAACIVWDMRLAYSLALVLCIAASAALADDAPRYALSAARDGFVRLDTVTGAVTHCLPADGVWRCEPIAGVDDSHFQALAAEVARLTADVALLGHRVDDLAAAKPEAVAPAPSVIPAPPPPAARPNPIVAVMDRLLDFVRALKHGRQPA